MQAFYNRYVNYIRTMLCYTILALIMMKLGFSGVMGVCTAIALKRVSRQIAVVVGIVFGGLQALAYTGYISIDYKKVSNDAQKALDVTGDGKFDANDIKTLGNKAYDVLKHGLSAAGSFSAGFAVGFHYM
jgi:uncharacterized membrane protein (Fun14 family)